MERVSAFRQIFFVAFDTLLTANPEEPLETAVVCFEQSILSCRDLQDHRRVVQILSCLAFVQSNLAMKGDTITTAQKAYDGIILHDSADVGGLGFYIRFLGSAYKNIGDFGRSYEMFERAIFWAEEGDFTQNKAQALIGISDLYREQGEFQKALACHLESLDLLGKIGAKCDLAEAHYQLELTYKVINEVEKSNSNFQSAIQLFSEIEAPKQVKRVRRSMEYGSEAL